MEFRISEEPVISVFKVAHDTWRERKYHGYMKDRIGTRVQYLLPFIVSLMGVSFVCPEDGSSIFFETFEPDCKLHEFGSQKTVIISLLQFLYWSHFSFIIYI
jgi:hypothetical protein